jgi:hypothetical protein
MSLGSLRPIVVVLGRSLPTRSQFLVRYDACGSRLAAKQVLDIPKRLYCCAIERTILQTAGRSPRPGLALHNQARKTSKKKIGPYEGRTRDLGVYKA